MEKAFDLKALEAKLTAKGLPAVEGLAEIVHGCVFEWAEESIALEKNALVKAVAAPAVAALKALALEQINKIDGDPA